MSLVAFSVFMLMGLIGIPLAHALIAGSLIAIERYDVGSTSIVLEQVVTQASSFPLLAIPFFILTANASIAALFIAGVLPGLLPCMGFVGVCYVSGRTRGFPPPR